MIRKIGSKTVKHLKARLNQHRRPSTNEAQNSAVYNHCKASNHSFKPEEVFILDKGDGWFKRGVLEAIENALNSQPHNISVIKNWSHIATVYDTITALTALKLMPGPK